jgi:hypothetical protein
VDLEETIPWGVIDVHPAQMRPTRWAFESVQFDCLALRKPERLKADGSYTPICVSHYMSDGSATLQIHRTNRVSRSWLAQVRPDGRHRIMLVSEKGFAV